jgi:hypothetical protein
MYKPVIAQPVTETAYNGYYNDKPEYNPYDFNSQSSSYSRSSYGQPKQIGGYGLFDTSGFDKKGGNDGMTKKETKRAKDKEKYTNEEGKNDAKDMLKTYDRGGYNTDKMQKDITGKGAVGKMLKKAAADATVRLLNSGTNRATHEMDNRGKKGAGLKFKRGLKKLKIIWLKLGLCERNNNN